MNKHMLRTLFSGLLIIALLSPAVAKAMPAASQPLTDQTSAGYLFPAAPELARAPDVGTPVMLPLESAAPLEPVGRLLLSPAIDADGDPLTNPAGSVPVQRVGGENPSQDVLYAEISLAAEVLPDDPSHNPAGAAVTFRVWHETDPVELVRKARSDAWGAAATQIFFDDLHLAGRWFYQASAPGYGETPVRSFTFDTSSYSQELRLGAARVTTEVEASGRLVVDITSDVAMDDSPSAAELIVVRVLPASEGQDAPAKQMLPAMVARRIDPFHARAEIFLDGGDYQLTALVHAGSSVAQSAPASVSLPVSAPPPIGSVDAIYDPSPDGATVLALYRTPHGDAALMRRDLADLPPPADPVEPPALQETRRVGAFQWQVETYSLQVQVNADDGKKRAYLDGFSWDPLARRYEIVIESLMDEPVEDKLTVQVYGPGDVVIYEETVPILLDPARPLHHTVSVPADLGEPKGIRIVVHDPLDVRFSSQPSALAWFAEKIETAIDTSFNFLQSLLPAEVDITGSFKGSVTLFGIELATWTQMCELKVCPPMSTGGLFFQPGDWVNIVTDGVRNYVRDTFNTSDIDEAVKRLKDGLPLGTGSGTAILGLRYTRSFYRGRCNDPVVWEAAKNMAVALGRKVKGSAVALNGNLSDLATRLQRDPWEPFPVPLVPFLSFQFAPILTFQVDGDYQAPVSVWGEFNGNLGIQLTVLLASGGSYLSLVGKAWSYYDKLNLLWQTLDALILAKDLALLAYRAHQFRANCPDPAPNGNPDDRRDAFQNQFVPEPSGAEGQLAYAARQLESAQQLGLSRAETYWMLRLRQAEQAAENMDPTMVISETLEQQAILVESKLHTQALLDGTILPEPGQTITDAMTSLYNDFFVQMENTSFLRRQRELRDAVDFAQRQYNLLHGQELALQQELRIQLGQAGFGVLDSGLVTWALAAMDSLGVKAAPVQIVAGASTSGLRDSRYYTPFEAPSVLLVPSGGFNRYGASQEARAWLNTYVNLGGTLIVLAQADSQDWDLLPGGQVEGLGYEQDILCKTASVRIVNSSPWIKGIGRDLPDIQIDGSFTGWPADATVVLMRTTGNQMPAMIEYDYGAGHVVAMSAYPDFYINGMQSVEDVVFARSLFGLAYLHATGQSVAATVNGPGAPVSLAISVTNQMAFPAAGMTLERDYYTSRVSQSWRWAVHRPAPLQGAIVVDIAPDLPRNGSTTVNASFTAPPQAGIFRTGYYLASTWASPTIPQQWWASRGREGPFYEVQSAYTPPPGFSLRADRDRFAFGETATITATVQNNLSAPRTLTLEPQSGLDDGPVTLNLPALGTAQHVYTTLVYERREIRVGLAEGGVPLSVLPLVLRLSPPFLGLETSVDRLPAGLAKSVEVTATLVDGRASQVAWEARLAGALVDSATTSLTPSGVYSVTTTTLNVPAAAVGDELTFNAALVGVSGEMTRTVTVQPPMTLAGLSLNGPLVIDAANAGGVRVSVDDAGFAGSGQVQAFLRRNSDLALIASSPLHGVTLGGGSQFVDLDLPLPAALDAAQTYSVLVEGTGQAAGGAPVNVSRTLSLPPIALGAVLIDAVRAVRDPMLIRVYSTNGRPGILPSGPFAVTVASASPPWSASQTASAAVEIGSLIVQAVTPELPRGGEYQVTVQTAQLAGWSRTDTLVIPNHELHFAAPASLTAGEIVTWTVNNEAGVDTTVAGALSLLDDEGVAVARQPVSAPVPVHGSATVTMTTPTQLRTGLYRLRWSGVDHLDNLTGDEHPLALTGLEVALDSQTDLPSYLSNETVSTVSVITPSAALEDAQLRLRVVSRGGNPYFGDYGEPGVVATTIAGGAVDAPAVGKALRYDLPGGVTFSPAGDHVLLGNGRVIQKVDTATWQGRVVAGRSGMGNTAVDGVGLAARFAANLMSVSMSGDASFALLVEFGRGIIRRYDTATGQVSFVAGGGGGCADGVGTAARFNFPGQSAVSHDGSFALVTDTCGLRRIDLATGAVTTLVSGLTGGVAIGTGDSYALVAFPDAHTVNLVTLPGGANVVLAGANFAAGSADGVGGAARFNNPGGVAISADGAFALISDAGNHTVRRVSLPGAAVTTVAGAVGQAGFANGAGSAARFDGLRNVAISPNGSYALLEDRNNDAVRRLDLATNDVTTVLGNWRGADGLGNEARFSDPWDVAVSSDGSFALIANMGSATIRRIDLVAGAVTTLAGAYDQNATVDGIGAAARFYFPAGVAISPDDMVALVVDDAHDVVRRIDLATLDVTTVAGAANQSGFVDGIGGAARFNSPQDVVFSPDGSYALIADWGNNAIRKLDLASNEVATFVAPSTGGLDDPRSIDISSDGSFALVGGVADCAVFRVEISGGAATGVAQFAGNGTCDPVDGVGLDASFDKPTGIAISPDGSVALVAERFATVVRLIDLATAEVTTVAGVAWEDTTMRDGPGAAARIYQPIGVDFGPDGTWALTTVQLGNAIARLDLTTLPKAQVQTAVNRLPNSNGPGDESRLYAPSDVAVSGDGRYALIADSGNYEIRLLELLAPERTAAGAGRAPFDPHGVTMRTVAGLAGSLGSADGAGSAARFDWVEAVAINVNASWGLVADTYNHTVRHVDLFTGQVTTVAGTAGSSGSADGIGGAARFNSPAGLVLSPDESFALISDTFNHTIRRLDLASGQVTTLAGQAGSSGSADGVGSAARFFQPRGIAISGDASFALVADEGSYTVRHIDLTSLAVTTLAGNPGVAGSGDGVAGAARFNRPFDVSLSADGSRALVADGENHLIRRIDVATAQVTTLAGQPGLSGYYDGAGSGARFALPMGVSLDASGDWALVADSTGSTIRTIDANDGAVDTLVSLPLHEDGVGHDVRLNDPRGVALSADGTVALLVDTSSNTVRRYDLASGEVTTIAGDANELPGSADGAGAAARFRYPRSGALSHDGGVAYIADSFNHTIRRVDMASGVVTTLAGQAGVSGVANGVGAAARFNQPQYLALSPDESYLLISDNHAIRRLDLASLLVATVAGSQGAPGNSDGPGGAARFTSPGGVAISADGNFALIADTGNHLVRRLSLIDGWVTRVAGWPGWSGSLDGFFDSAYFSSPQTIAISGDGGYALVMDSGSGLVRRVGLVGLDAGVVTTLAGAPFAYGVADGLGSSARFYWLTGVAMSNDPTFALALDSEAGVVRRLGLPGQGIAPAAVLRQEWQPVAGVRSADELIYWLSFLDPNLLEDGRARGQLFLEADLFSNAPAEASSPGRRHRLASAEYPFLVDDASGGLAFSSRRLAYRRNLPGYAPDDDASAVTLNGLVRNTSPTAATIQVTVTRDGSTVLSSQTFAGIGPDETRFFSAVDPGPPAGTVVYTAATDLGSSVAETVTIQAPAINAMVSAQPDTIVLGESTTLQLALVNSGSQDAYVSADLGNGSGERVIAAGQTITLTRELTPMTAGPASLPVTLGGDLQGVQSAALTVRDESALAVVSLAGQVRAGRAPLMDPQLVRSDNAALVFTVSPLADAGFDVLASYVISGPVILAGSELVDVQPGGTPFSVSLASAPAGAYTATLDVQHASLGTALASASLAFELVEPAYALSLAATVTDLDGSVAKQIDITASSGAASEGSWSGALRLRGALVDEDSLALAPGVSSAHSEVLALENRAGEQTLIVELVNPDGSVAASQTVTMQAAPRAAPEATLTGVVVDPAPAGGALTVGVTVENSGRAGEVLLEVVAFDQVTELIGEAAGATTLHGPAATTVFSLTAAVPPDLLADIYPVLVRLGDQELRADAQITGAQIDLRQSLNADVYQPDSLATWTVELEGLAGAPAQYDVEMRYGEQANVQTISVGAGVTVQVPWTFAVGPVSERATVLVQTHPLSPQQTRHSLIIDSQWIPVQEDVRAWLETDKSRYDAGETVYLTYHLETPMQSAMVMEPDGLLGEPGPLVWSSLEVSPTAALTYTITITDPVTGAPVNQTVVLTETNWVQGDFAFDYTLPPVMSTGRYFFTYFFGGEERTWPIDVFGVDLRVEEFRVSGVGVGKEGKEGAWEMGGAVTVKGKLQLDVPVASARIAAYGLGPDEQYLDLGPTAVVTMPLPAGVTPVALSGLFIPQRPGAHQIVLMVRDAASLAELGGEAAFVDVGQASINSLFTDQGAYLPGEPGTGELTVYGVGPTTVVVTATNGSTLLNTVVTLNGFDRFNFAIPTASYGDYLLVARTVDATGMADSALRAYAVPLSPDTEPPVLTVTNPSTHTILYSSAPTMTLTVQGQVSDNRGPVTVYIDGRPAGAIVDSGWSAPVTLSQGSNALSVVALDDAGNFAAAPLINIILTSQGAVSHAPDRTSASVGQQLTFQSTLQATGIFDNAQLIQYLPPGRTSSVTAGASRGEVLGIAQGPEGVFVHWKGNVDNVPVTVAVTVTLSSAGVLTSTATAFWGWGLSDQAAAAPVQVNSPLAVGLASFTATQMGDQALLAWETVSEIDHLGFNAYRGGSPDGPWLRVNEALIPSPSPGSTAGHVYELLDALPPGVTWYRLEAVDTRGVAADVGLISIEPATVERRLWLPVVVRGAP